MPPEPDVVSAQLGKGSVAWIRARNDMRRMYVEVSGDPEVRTKRALWSQLLARVYGSPVDDDDLFFQHTYLTAIAKTMAAHVIGIGDPTPEDLLSGRLFEQAGISTAWRSRTSSTGCCGLMAATPWWSASPCR